MTQLRDTWKAELRAEREARRPVLVDALDRAEGNITHAASFVGLSRQRLTIELKDLGLQAHARDLRKRKAGASKSGLGRPREGG